MFQVLCCVWHYLSAGRQWWNCCSGKRRFCTETFTHSFICVWFIHSFINPSIHSFCFFLTKSILHPISHTSCKITFSEVCPSFVLSFIHSFVHSVFYQIWAHTFPPQPEKSLFLRGVIHSFIHSFCFLPSLGPFLSSTRWKNKNFPKVHILTQVTKDVIEEFADDNVKYLELRSTPRANPAKGIWNIKYRYILQRKFVFLTHRCTASFVNVLPCEINV